MKRDLDRRWDVVIRLVSGQAESADSVEAAIARVGGALSPQYQDSLDQLGQLLQGAAPEKSEHAELAHWLQAVRVQGGQVLPAFASACKSIEETRRHLAGFFLGLADQGVYLLALVVVLGLVMGIYSAFVFPSFQHLFAGFGGEMPQLPQVIFGQTYITLGLLLLLGLAVAGLWRTTLQLRRRLRTLQPLGRRTAKLPLLGVAARHHHALLWLQWLMVMLDGRLQPAAARDAVSQRLGAFAGSADVLAALDGAQRLGVLRAELEAQIELQVADLMRALTRARTVLLYALRLLVYLIIVTSVAAMYLPLFGLGALV
jgi:type II secretory pathway component PulF